MHRAQLDCTWEVGLGAAGFVAGAAEGPGGAGVTVLRLWAATSKTPHLTVRPIHHLYELSHPEDAGEGGRTWKQEGREENGRCKNRKRKKGYENRRLNKIKVAETSLKKGQEKKQVKIIKLIGILSMKP